MHESLERLPRRRFGMASRWEKSDADVRRPLPDRKDPPVPRHRHVVEPQLELARDVCLQVFEVRPCREHCPWLSLEDSRSLQNARRSPCRDDRDPPVKRAPILCVHAHAALIGRQMSGGNALLERRSAGGGVSDDQVVQHQAWDHHRAVAASDPCRGPSTVGRHDRVTVHFASLLRDLVEQAHLVEYPQRTRREPIAARLVARERAAVQQHDVESAAAQKVRRGRPTRAGADDDRVMYVHHAIG